MERLIGENVQSKRFGQGIVESVEKCDDKYEYKIVINFNTKPIQFYFTIAMNKDIFSFLNAELNNYAQIKAKTLKSQQAEQDIIEKKKAHELIQAKQHEEMIKKSHEENNIEKYDSLFNSNDIVLTSGRAYGTKALTIYKNCCDKFGWDYSSAGYFAPQKYLYANKVAGNYSVWFIAHSNFTSTSSKRWHNKIIGNTIEEEYENNSIYCPSGDERIVFYKNMHGQYIFAGIYKQESYYKNDNNHLVMVYKLLSTSYPIA